MKLDTIRELNMTLVENLTLIVNVTLIKQITVAVIPTYGGNSYGFSAPDTVYSKPPARAKVSLSGLEFGYIRSPILLGAPIGAPIGAHRRS